MAGAEWWCKCCALTTIPLSAQLECPGCLTLGVIPQHAGVADAMSQRLETAEAVKALSEVHGTGKAVAHQAGLWEVTVGKTKAVTSSRIVNAIEASQEAAREDTQPQDNESTQDSEEELDGFV